jgi:streptogramin lyase
MKSSFARTIASTLLCLFAFASASLAATKKPLSLPFGLAVDAKGNLYVANSGGNDILVYSPAYAQIPTKTITQSVSNPTGVAFDHFGNLWIANYGTSNGGANGSISEYTNGKQNTSGTITNGILAPEALAIDGLGNIWVENDYLNVTIYGQQSVYGPTNNLVRTLNFSSSVYGIAFQPGTFAWGSNSATTFVAVTPALVGGALNGGGYGNDTGVALASDASGNVYIGNLDGSVNIATTQGAEYFVVQLPFAPKGIAVDSKRERIYFSDYNGNTIAVYSTAGVLLKTIQ